jgi:hypothetical protein
MALAQHQGAQMGAAMLGQDNLCDCILPKPISEPYTAAVKDTDSFFSTVSDPIGSQPAGPICSSLTTPRDRSKYRDEGQASIEWKAGIDGQRTHLVLGFEQIPAGGTRFAGSCR